MNLTRLRALKPTRALASALPGKKKPINIFLLQVEPRGYRRQQLADARQTTALSLTSDKSEASRASKRNKKRIMWQKLILGATALAVAAADGAAKPAFLQACEDDGDAGCAAKLATAAV